MHGSERSKGSCFGYAQTSRPFRHLRKRVAFNGALCRALWRVCSGVVCPTCCVLLARRSFQGMAQCMASETRTDSSVQQSTAAAKQAQRCSTLRPVFGQSRGARECDRTPEPILYDEEGSRRGLRPPRGTFRAQCTCTPCALLSAKGTQGTRKAR